MPAAHRRTVSAGGALGWTTLASRSRNLPEDVDAAIGELEALYDTAGWLRSVPDTVAPREVAVQIRSLLTSGRYRLVTPPLT